MLVCERGGGAGWGGVASNSSLCLVGGEVKETMESRGYVEVLQGPMYARRPPPLLPVREKS